jgi:hypothetical protein
MAKRPSAPSPSSPNNLVGKDVKGRAYLYELFDRKGNGKSLGPSNADTEEFADYQERKAELKARRQGTSQTLETTARMSLRPWRTIFLMKSSCPSCRMNCSLASRLGRGAKASPRIPSRGILARRLTII